MRRISLVLLLAACRGWGNLPDQDNVYTGPLWDPNAVWSTPDGLYLSLPASKGLGLLDPATGKLEKVVLEGDVDVIRAAPDGERLAVFTDERVCKDPDGELEDCDDFTDKRRLAVVQGGRAEVTVDISEGWNQLTFTPDGRTALLSIDTTLLDDVGAVLDLTSLLAVNLDDGASATVHVGFAPDELLFTTLPDGTNDRAVVLAYGEVAVVDLMASPPIRTVSFPLVLDPDDIAVPSDVVLTPDGNHAMLSIAGATELYILDLLNPNINIVDLDAPPVAMNVSAEADNTLIVSTSASSFTLVDHQFFDATVIEIDEPKSAVLDGGAFDLLWSPKQGQDVLRVDPLTGGVVEYRLQTAPTQLLLSPTEEFAIALTAQNQDFGSPFYGHPGLEILNLASEDVQPLLLESQGIAAAFTATEGSLHALILQEGVDYVYALDLYGGQNIEIDLEEPPITIGALSDGNFYVTHDDPMGLISIVDPDGDVTLLSGFATTGIFDAFGPSESGDY